MAKNENRLAVLDGWRGISILAVLVCHLLPLGPRKWDLNYSAGLFGMALFFTLSGFLITRFLLRGATVKDFLIRRFCRILPLAWGALAIGLWMQHAPDATWLPNFAFFANLPPFWLLPTTSHYWSLCVEMQFYAAAAAVYGFFGRRGLIIAIPVGAIVITVLRIDMGMTSSVVSYFRGDEILAGGFLAMVYEEVFGEEVRRWAAMPSPLLLLGCYVLSTLAVAGPVEYLRPYLASALVGSTLLRRESAFHALLRTRTLAYVAEISYALYVLHPILTDTWLGAGGKLVKYLKRPLLLGAIWALSHLSTRYYERHWIELGKRLSMREMPASRLATP